MVPQHPYQNFFFHIFLPFVPPVEIIPAPPVEQSPVTPTMSEFSLKIKVVYRYSIYEIELVLLKTVVI